MAKFFARRPGRALRPVLLAASLTVTTVTCGGAVDPTGVTLTIASVQILNQGLGVDRFVITTQAEGELPRDNIVDLHGRPPRGSETVNLRFATRLGGSNVAIGVAARFGEQLIAEGGTQVQLRRERMVSAEVLLRSCLAASGPFCDGDTLVTCDPVDDLTVRTACAFGCNTAAARCNLCTPSTVACHGDRFVLCDAEGLPDSDEDCAQVGGACQAGRCTLGGCVLTAAADTAPCDDGQFCTEDTVCTAGICGSGTPRRCDDDNACTFDTCDEINDACSFDPLPYDLRSCDDGSFCTVGETCLDGVCGGGSVNTCADGNPCTEDICNNSTSVCENPNKLDGTLCEDGLFCTAGDRCEAGSCTPGTANPCFDANPCTDNSCDEAADACTFPCTAPGTTCDPVGNTEVTCDGNCKPALTICAHGCNAALTACNECAPGTTSCHADLSLLCNAEIVCDAAGRIATKSCCSSNRCTCDGASCLEDLCASAPSISASTTVTGTTCGDDNIPGDCLPGGAACLATGAGEQMFRLLLDDGDPTRSTFYRVLLDSTGSTADTTLRLSTVCGNETRQLAQAEVCALPAGSTPQPTCSEEEGPDALLLCGLPEGQYFGAVDTALGTACGEFSLEAEIDPVTLDSEAQAGNISRGGVFYGNTCTGLGDRFAFRDWHAVSGCTAGSTGDCEDLGGGSYYCPSCTAAAATDCTVSFVESHCAYNGSGSPDAVFYLALTQDSGVDLSTAGSRFDTVLSIVAAGPNGAIPPGAVRLCNDDCWADDGASHIQTALPAGLYYVVLDGANRSLADRCGDYVLTVKISPATTCPNLGCEPPFESCVTCPFDCPCPTCGNGLVELDDGETCDDNNTVSGDGCSSCILEPGWTCTGAPSVCSRHCGNGAVEPALGEACDDGGDLAGDGCNADCALEANFVCTGSPSLCRPGARARQCPGLPVPDNNVTGVTDTITISSSFTVADVTVDVDIQHDYIGDLTVRLIAPDNTTLYLHNRSGDSTSNIAGNYDLSLTPDGGSMSVFDGKSASGAWRLRVVDADAQIAGYFNCWALNLIRNPECGNGLCEPPSETCANCADCTCSNCGDGVIQRAQGETCDDGARLPNDGCSADCDVEPTWECSGQPSDCVHEVHLTRCPNLPIPDAQNSSTPGVAADVLVVPSGCTAADVTVDVDIAHAYRGDLIVELRSPNTTVRLHDLSGGSEDDIVGNYDVNLTPDGPGTMASFDSKATAGTWTLWMSDNDRYVAGTLQCWTLNIICQ